MIDPGAPGAFGGNSMQTMKIAREAAKVFSQHPALPLPVTRGRFRAAPRIQITTIARIREPQHGQITAG